MKEPLPSNYEAATDLSSIIDFLPCMIYRRKNDSTWRMEYVSKGSKKITGYSPEEFLIPGKIDYKDLFHEEDKKNVLGKIDFALNNKEPFTINYRIIDNNRNVKWIFERGEGIFSPDNELIAVEGFMTNDGEGGNILDADKGKLFSMIAHDLKSPFTALLGYSEIIAMEFDTLTADEIKRYSIEINKALKNQFNLLEDLLSWARLETGAIQVGLLELNLFERVKSAVDLLIVNAQDKNISLINKVSAEQDVFADEDMLHSILKNLLSNAIKFTKPGGLINIISTDAGKFVELTVEDNGIGIKRENINKIFGLNCFTTYGTNNEKGTGLGLLLTKEMVEKNGGTIHVESVYGKGSKFTVTLPKPSSRILQN
jgi:signal transduction histidine kinase